jgi:hypothetical protein
MKTDFKVFSSARDEAWRRKSVLLALWQVLVCSALAWNILIFSVLGGPLSVLIPKLEAIFPLGKVFEFEPTMAQYERMLLNILEVA